MVAMFFRFDDGMVEVFALYSSFHIAQLQVGLAEPLRLGQAKTVKVNNTRSTSVKSNYILPPLDICFTTVLNANCTDYR